MSALVRRALLLAVLLLPSLVPPIGAAAEPPILPLQAEQSGQLRGDSGGAFLKYRFFYPGDGSPVGLELRVRPGRSDAVGFRLYGPSGEVAGKVPAERGDHLVQVYNYDPALVVDFTLLATGLPTAPSAAPPSQPTGQPAAAASPTPAGACAYAEIDSSVWGGAPLRNPPDLRAADGRLVTTLGVRYTDPQTTSLAGCPLTLRSYNGALVGPTLRVRPGETLGILLDNQLPVQSPQAVAAQLAQETGNAFIGEVPHDFNTTNLHTHGLHVSPTCTATTPSVCGDNVLIAVPPQSRQQYEIKLPPDHPAGTYWYHAHAHGSTAVQVGSGMAGTIVVEDDERKVPPALREANRREKVMVFGTILYDTSGRADDITAFFPGVWESSKRRTTINGQIVPVIRMRPGEVQRWRMVDAAFRASLLLRLEGHALHEIALDGIYLGKVDSWSSDPAHCAQEDPTKPDPACWIDLEPGYRSDVLVQASRTPGTYRLLDGPSTTATSLRGVDEPQNVVALVEVAGEPLGMALPTDAEMAALNPFPGLVLQNGQLSGVQQAVFKLGSSPDPNDGRNYFQVNYEAFNHARVRQVELNAIDRWSLTTVGDPPGVPVQPPPGTPVPTPFPQPIPPLPHVFHIHVNPFQWTRTDPSGQPELVWKDTLLIPGGQQVTVYTQYRDFLGPFVLHCHILDHEDLGMMEVVQVVEKLPPPSGAAATGIAHGGHQP